MDPARRKLEPSAMGGHRDRRLGRRRMGPWKVEDLINYNLDCDLVVWVEMAVVVVADEG